ncbi:MAG: glycosyltransferase family 39 protein [Nanoarchaeota archaeon]|nr:glycosyltransferase family 39 protein [Nanoarchaeota archaeon]
MKLNKKLAIILIIGLIIRFLIAPSPGYINDNKFWNSWTYAMVEHGFPYVFSTTEDANYPPFYMYALYGIGLTNKHILKDDFTLDGRMLFLYKMPPVISDFILALIIFFFLMRELKNERLALLASAFYFFNPAVLFNSPYWGQADSVQALLMIASLIYVYRGKYKLGWMFFALAFLMKMQSIVIAPVILAYTFKKIKFVRTIKAILISFITCIVLSLPYIIAGEFWKMILTMLKNANIFPHLSIYAFNFWWLFVKGRPERTSDAAIFLFMQYRYWSLLMLSIAALFAIYYVWKSRNKYRLFIASAFMIFSFFMLVTEIHERYLVPILSILVILYFLERTMNSDTKRYSLMFWILTFTTLLNMMYVLRNDLVTEIYRTTIIKGVGSGFALLISIIHIIIYIWFARFLWKELKEKPQPISEEK